MAVQAQYPLGRVVEDARELALDQSAAAQLFNANISPPTKRIRDDDHHNSTLTIPTKTHSLRRHHQRSEDQIIDALIRVHVDKVRARVAEIGKSHCRDLLSAMARRIGDKEAELAAAARKNAELESRMKEAAAQRQIWLNYASTTEAAARGLRAALDRVIRRVSGDAESCCDDRPRRTGSSACRVCRERDASVLLLPCRHLCLCRECEPEVDACPVCNARKNGGLQVLMG